VLTDRFAADLDGDDCDVPHFQRAAAPFTGPM